MLTDENSNACDACGTFVELGAVINEDDTILLIPIFSVDMKSFDLLANIYIDAAKKRFPSVIVTKNHENVKDGIESTVSMEFECSAEKIIFEMGLSSLGG